VIALLGAVLSGVLTTLAPCVLPLLPVIVGGSVASAPGPAALTGRRRAVVVTAALGASIVVFTLLLKASTALIGVPAQVWSALAGGLLVALGVVGVWPRLWTAASERLGLQQRTTVGLAGARRRSGVIGAIATGAALGPVFSSCSPLYAYVVVTVLPSELGYGLVLLAGYALGLCAMLLAVALLGQRLIHRLGWAADADSPFRRVLGAVFVVVGVAVIVGLDKSASTWILDHTPVEPWTFGPQTA